MELSKINKLNPTLFLEKTKEVLKKYDKDIIKIILIETYIKKRKMKKNLTPKNVYNIIKNRFEKENLRVLHFDLLIEEAVEYINDSVLVHSSRKEKKEKRKVLFQKKQRIL